MIKPTCKTEFHKTNNYFVWAEHTIYDTSVESLTPPVLRRYKRLNIQWHNVWAKIKSIFTPPQLVSPFMPYHWQRGAISLVGSPYLNDDWTSAGDAEQTGVHGTIATITIAGVSGTGADILVARTSADTAKTMSATYNSVSLTTLASVTTNRSAHIQYLGSPSSGSNTYVGTFSSADNGFGILTMYSGTAGTMSGGLTTSGNSTSASLSPTTTSGDLAVDVLTIGTAASAITIGGGQTQRGSNTTDLFFHELRASDETASGVSTTMSWTWTTSANYAFAAGTINQAVASTFVPRVNGII